MNYGARLFNPASHSYPAYLSSSKHAPRNGSLYNPPVYYNPSPSPTRPRVVSDPSANHAAPESPKYSTQAVPSRYPSPYYRPDSSPSSSYRLDGNSYPSYRPGCYPYPSSAILPNAQPYPPSNLPQNNALQTGANGYLPGTNLNRILIAILILVALDLVVVRPYKYTSQER
ncbi:MAG: hypothetical protein ACYCVD_07160 [Desulfitobacteriaceae bacterium]